MKRHFLEILFVFSLLLLAITVLVWARSLLILDEIHRNRWIDRDQTTLRIHEEYLLNHGRITYIRIVESGPRGEYRQRRELRMTKEEFEPFLYQQWAAEPSEATDGFLGFRYAGHGSAFRLIAVPLWSLMALVAIWPAVRIVRWWRAIRRPQGVCSECGASLVRPPKPPDVWAHSLALARRKYPDRTIPASRMMLLKWLTRLLVATCVLVIVLATLVVTLHITINLDRPDGEPKPVWRFIALIAAAAIPVWYWVHVFRTYRHQWRAMPGVCPKCPPSTVSV